MFHPRYHWSLFLLPLALTGCSATNASKFGGTAQSRSIAVSGDRNMPVTVGEPGGQVAADAIEPEPRRDPVARISGRVLDDQGQAVPDATVRLADGSSRGGRDLRTTTDASGAFTLSGLRIGSTYAIVAESEDARGSVLTGQAQAKTSDTRVQIRLGSTEAIKKSSRPGSRARPISVQEEATEDPFDNDRPVINREDVGSTTDDEAPIEKPRSSTRKAPQLAAPEATVGWRKGGGVAKPTKNQDDQPDTLADSTSNDRPQTKRRAARPTPPAVEADDEEGPNPLPPAIEFTGQDDAEPAPAATPPRAKPRKKPAAPAVEPGGFSTSPETRSNETTDPDPPPLIAQEPPPSQPVPMPSMLPEMGSEPAPQVAQGLPAMPPMGNAAPPGPTPSPPPTDLFAQTSPTTNPAPEPVFALPPPLQIPPTTPVVPPEPAEYNPFVLAGASAPEVAPSPAPAPRPRVIPASAKPGPPPLVAQQVQEVEPVPASVAPEKPKKKWGDVSAPESKVAAAPDTPKTTSFLSRLKRNPVDAREGVIPTCEFDASKKRLVDFVLPDLQGNPVRLQDLDSEYILLDFWGTWCQPCLTSIPHLVEIQKQYGPDKIRVVGIACEKTNPQVSRVQVDQYTRKLSINYPVLLSDTSGKDPLQNALNVRYFPTMILVDRQGQIVWSAEGATQANMYRLDRFLATAIGKNASARR